MRKSDESLGSHGSGITRRVFVGGMALGLSAVSAGAFEVPDEPPQLTGDYAEARRNFRTRLVKRGPAPDKFEPWTTASNAETITYRTGDSDDLELRAWVSRTPPGARNRPAVLFLHGGNSTGAGHWELMTPYIEAGYVVMLPTFRGENGQAGDFSGFYNEAGDAMAAADWLAHHPAVNPDRMFLAGHSNGGTLSMLVSMTTGRFRAAVPISGNTNAYAFFNRFRDDIRFDADNPREFEMRSSACYAHSFKCPILLLRASEEKNNEKRLQVLEHRARKAGTIISLETLPGSHNGAVPGEIKRSIEFFKPFLA